MIEEKGSDTEIDFPRCIFHLEIVRRGCGRGRTRGGISLGLGLGASGDFGIIDIPVELRADVEVRDGDFGNDGELEVVAEIDGDRNELGFTVVLVDFRLLGGVEQGAVHAEVEYGDGDFGRHAGEPSAVVFGSVLVELGDVQTASDTPAKRAGSCGRSRQDCGCNSQRCNDFLHNECVYRLLFSDGAKIHFLRMPAGNEYINRCYWGKFPVSRFFHSFK